MISSFEGIDLAIYGIRSKIRNQNRTKEGIGTIFGICNIDVAKLNFESNEKGTYSRKKYVYPLYDKVSKIAKDIIVDPLKNKKYLLEISDVVLGKNNDERKTLYLSPAALYGYCKTQLLDLENMYNYIDVKL